MYLERLVAKMKCLGAGFQGRRSCRVKSYIRKVDAFIKSIISDAHDTCRDNDAGKVGAAVERTVTDALDSPGYLNSGKAAAV